MSAANEMRMRPRDSWALSLNPPPSKTITEAAGDLADELAGDLAERNEAAFVPYCMLYVIGILYPTV